MPAQNTGCAPQHPVDPDAERVRVKKLASYFGSLGIVPEDSGNPPCNPVSTSPTLARDATLTALAQLGPLRLQCDRAFISLIDRSHQYIIAEATRSLSYYDFSGNARDPVYLGVVAFDIAWGVCPNTIHVFTDPTGQSDVRTPNVQADRTKYRIRDFQDDPVYVDRPYVREWPHMRTYLEVPLRTSTGEVIGSYCVVDNRLRDDWDDAAVEVMDEIGQTIMGHIELVKMQDQHKRLERLVNSLCVYVEENTSMQASFEDGIPTGDWPPDNPPGESPGCSPNSGPVRGVPHAASCSVDSLDTQLTTPSPGPQRDPFETSSLDSSRQSKSSSLTSRRPPSKSTSSSVPDAFSRAASLIQEATDIEGIVFLDASPNGFATRLNPKSGDAVNNRSSVNLSSPHETNSTKMCETLGVSISGDAASDVDRLTVPEPLLQNLLQAHPRGSIFFADELEELGGEEGEVGRLFQTFTMARSILFMPLWDYQKEGWYAAAFGWSTQSNRIFASEDLVYISAFGNSIMTEVSRIEAMTVSHAKSNFISSISHELRSPLHGILASVELLRQTALDPERLALAEMIEICGTTLLETMDHLLDFAKINHLTRKGRRSSSKSMAGSRGGSRSRKEHLSLSRTADLSILVQEVVAGAYLGHSAQATSKLETAGTKSSKKQFDRASSPERHPVLLTMDIEKRSDWRIHTEPGAWRRIVLNLVGNALKYTDRGSIEVSLKTEDTATDLAAALSEGRVPGGRRICLSVKDTGRGIGADYLKYRLFTPYAQEDPLVSGTGLGLSIVNHLVTHLGGKVDVQSEVDVGTQIQVTIPVPASAGSVTPKGESDRNPFEKASQILRGKVITALAATGSQPDADAERLLSNALQTAEQWWGMKVASNNDADSASTAEFCLLHASQLEAAHANGALQDINTSVLVLCTRLPSQAQIQTASSYNATFLQQPFGPKKLKASLKAALSRRRHSSVHKPSADPAGCSALPSKREIIYREGSTAIAIGAPTTIGHRRPEPPSMPPRQTGPECPPTTITTTTTTTTTQQPPFAPAQPKQAALHLLLVEDNDINLRILTTYAKALNCTFATATNGREAADAFSREGESTAGFDVVLMDVSMPVMNGFEATREIRAWERARREGGDQGRKGCRILALTGLGSAESQREAFSSGMDEFLIKPVPLRRLRAVLFGGDGGGAGKKK